MICDVEFNGVKMLCEIPAVEMIAPNADGTVTVPFAILDVAEPAQAREAWQRYLAERTEKPKPQPKPKPRPNPADDYPD